MNEHIAVGQYLTHRLLELGGPTSSACRATSPSVLKPADGTSRGHSRIQNGGSAHE
jgi:hypothetical protein